MSIDFTISQSNKNIIYLHSSVFKSIPHILNKVENIHKTSCELELINLCQQKPCNTLLVLALNSVNNIDNNIDNMSTNDIVGFMTVEIYNIYGEIYNLCVDKKYRNRGIANTMLSSLIKDFPKDKLWLGIDLNNSSFEKVLKLYLNAGFYPEGIQNITPSDKNPGFPFLAMIHVRGVTVKNDIKLILKVVQQYKNNNGLCQSILYITPSTMNTLNDFLSNSVEYGGVMIPRKISQNEYMLSLGALTKGSDDLTVVIPKGYITWHTHPFICYKNNLCYIAWPSGLDMNTILSQYMNGMLAHFIFTKEGTYIIQLTSQMMEFMKNIPFSCIESLGKLVEYYYQDLQHFREVRYDAERLDCLKNKNDVRCLTYDTKQKHLSINNILYIMGNLSVNDLLRSVSSDPYIDSLINSVKKCSVFALNTSKIETNFPIFDAKYIPSDVALQYGIRTSINYLIAPRNSLCTL